MSPDDRQGLAPEDRRRHRNNSRRWEGVPGGYCSNAGVPIGYGGQLDVLV